MKRGVIETGIPIPAARKLGRPRTYRLHELEVGQRLRLKRTSHKEWNRLRKAAQNFGRRSGRKFICRALSQYEMACWRTE